MGFRLQVLDASDQIFRCEGFLEATFSTELLLRRPSAAGDDQHARPFAAGREHPEQRSAVHHRHLHIEDHNGRETMFQHLKGFGTVRGGYHLEACRPENDSLKIPNGGFVIDYKYTIHSSHNVKRMPFNPDTTLTGR
jgi:hypothetical protein